MTVIHYSMAVAWKILGGLFLLGAAIFAMDPTVKVAYITAGALVTGAVVNMILGILTFIRQGKTGTQVDKIEVSTNSNTTRMLNKLDEQKTLLEVAAINLSEARSRADRAEARTVGDQDREAKSKEKQ